MQDTVFCLLVAYEKKSLNIILFERHQLILYNVHY